MNFLRLSDPQDLHVTILTLSEAMRTLCTLLPMPSYFSKYAERNALLAFKHGLRPSEVCELRLSDIDLKNGIITVNRL